MALLITDDCTGCDTCVEMCPNEAITADDLIYRIDLLRCTECVGAEDEPQCRTVCPAECIEPDPDWRESQEQLQMKYDQLHS
jgi:ferredoxin